MLDLNSWTLADVILFEELAGISISEVSDGMGAKAMAAAVYIEEKRKDSKVTFESVTRKSMQEITDLLLSYGQDDTVKK